MVSADTEPGCLPTIWNSGAVELKWAREINHFSLRTDIGFQTTGDRGPASVSP